MNKLPWFTHDHDAHEDLWLRRMIRLNGHHFSTLYWTTLGLLHWQGVGDKLVIEWRELSRATQIRTTKLREMLNHPEITGKMIVRSSRDHVEIQIPNLRKRWSKMKSKVTSKLLENTLQSSLELDLDKEKIIGPVETGDKSPSNQPQGTPDLIFSPENKRPVQEDLKALTNGIGDIPEVDPEQKAKEEKRRKELMEQSKKILGGEQ